MKIVHVLLIVLLPVIFLQAQGMRRQSADPKALEKIEQLENAKLIKMLDLNEEDAVRFFARRKEYLTKMHDYLRQRREFVDSTGELLKEDEKAGGKKCRDKIEEVFDLEAKIFKEKRNYYKSLANLISPKQILQLMIFEERFRREVREKLMGRSNKKNSD
ncbi:MAG: hypothetical protein WCZ90_13840 [Melioribacteraceae bacterium]